MDHVIEDLRRLSLNLSPSALEDLGLTSALKWLASDLSEISGVKAECRISEIDGLFNRNHWITIYRIIQEAFETLKNTPELKRYPSLLKAATIRSPFPLKTTGEALVRNGPW